MKKLLLLILITACSASYCYSQKFSVGARTGVNFANMIITNSVIGTSPSIRIGYTLGGYATFMFNDHIGAQAELLYSSIGGKYKYSSGGFSNSGTIRLNYLTLPIFFRYSPSDHFHLLVGPQLGVLLSAQAVVGGSTNDIKSYFSTTDLDFVVGAGADFGPFNAGLRLNAGLTNIDKGDSGTMNNLVIQMLVGYKFNHKFGK